MTRSLGDYIVDRTESLDEKLIQKYYIERDSVNLDRLIDTEQYLLEGSRGIGKTMLMKIAALKADKAYSTQSVLAVWISFEESLRLERIHTYGDNADPFLQWTMGKIMLETLKKLVHLKPNCLDRLQKQFARIFEITNERCNSEYFRTLESYISLLERGEIDNTNELENKSPSHELYKILDNPSAFKKFLLALCSDLNITRIVYLFDEAAHVFSSSQQERFFTFFKSLRDSRIACKAAVYPGLTHYGKSFERGQDAKEMRLSWSPLNTDNVLFVKEILKRRISEYSADYWHKLTVDDSIIRTICICSNGNPRFAFHIIDELESAGDFKAGKITNTKLNNAMRRVFENKWREFNTYESRMPKYKSFIAAAEQLIKSDIIPNLRKWNEKRRKVGKKLSLGFFVETNAQNSLSTLFDILSYANIISVDYTKKSIGQSFMGYFIMLNPTILFTELVIKDVSDIDNISIAIENNQAYYDTTPIVKSLISTLKIEAEYKCENISCGYITDDPEFKYCPKCGAKISNGQEVSLYKILRSHSIDNLSLSSLLINRLKEKFETIGDLQDASTDQIRMRYIQSVRIEIIKSAVTEYMAG